MSLKFAPSIFQRMLTMFTFKFQRYLEAKYTVTKNLNICNMNVLLDIRILWLVFMFDYTFEIMQVYLNQNFIPLQILLTTLPSHRQMQFTLIMKRSINFLLWTSSNLCFCNKIFTAFLSTIILNTIIFIIFWKFLMFY